MELLRTASVKKDVGTRGAKEILLVLLPTRLQQPVSIKVPTGVRENWFPGCPGTHR